MGMTFENDKWVLVCANCGTRSPQAWRQSGASEECSSCGSVKDECPRDAIGQKIHIPTDQLGKYSYAIGEVVHSARQYSRILKESGMALRHA